MILEKIEALNANFDYDDVIELIEKLEDKDITLDLALHYGRAQNNEIEYQKAINYLVKFDKEGKNNAEWHYILSDSYYNEAYDLQEDSGKMEILQKAQAFCKLAKKHLDSGLQLDNTHEELNDLSSDINALKTSLEQEIKNSIVVSKSDYGTLNTKEKARFVLGTLQETKVFYQANTILDIDAFKLLKADTVSERKLIINELLSYIGTNSHNRTIENDICAIVTALIRGNLEYNEEEWIALFDTFMTIGNKENSVRFTEFPLNYSIQQIERYLKKNEPSKALLSFISNALENPSFSDQEDRYWGSDIKKTIKKLHVILSDYGIHSAYQLNNNDIGPKVNTIISELKSHKEEYNQIFIQASEASESKPSQKFQDKINPYIEIIGADAYRKVAQDILETPLEIGVTQETQYYKVFLNSSNQQFIKGLIWTMERFSDKKTIRILSQLFQKGYEKIPGQGPAAASLGNACAYTLGNMRGKEGLGALSRIKLKLKQNNIKKVIDKYLIEGAKKYNVSVEELKEMAVPDFKLEQGGKTIVFEDYSLELNIVGSKVEQQWIKPDGTPMKSVPSSIKNSTTLSNKLKELRKEVKDIQKVYSTQKQRIDNQFILDREWEFINFNKYYLQHGLVYPITQKLIWTFTKGKQSVNAILLADKWYSVDHDLIDWIDDSTRVKLWHPVVAKESEIIAWREKMMDLEWKQPLKQAFRELYILTDAEINTKTYSNRMAAHILKQHQFSMLAGLRGWKYSLMGSYDDGIENEICSKYLPEHKITAEYWIDELNDYDAFNDAGIWLYISTDQVKFKNEEGGIMNMVDIPKIVFTEIMRDVDLFVGVASVGNDPLWMDNNGERQENRDYWQSYSFGNLTEIAKTRKSILERLLPRLKKIKDKTHIDGKFLVVKGEIRTYKIHIGSGNILMEPNDQYLCIVPSRSAETASNKVFIPFEGDKGLSIVLSKAFLLAEDKKITDSTIISQINHK